MKHAVLCVLLVSTLALAGCARGPAEEPAEYTVIVLRTSEGDLTVRFFDEEAPVTVGNFLALAHDGYYDDSPFHRIIRDFMMQGGDYTRGDGFGGRAHPDFDAGGGRIPDEFHPALRHDGKGVLSMANQGPDTGSSQFFITFAPTPHLDDRHAVFGRVTDGQTVLDHINQNIAGGQDGRPRAPMHFVAVQGVQCGPAAPEGLCDGPPLPDLEPPGGDGGPEPEPARVTAGVATPDTWNVSSPDERLLLWANNAGGVGVSVDLRVEGLPEGWTLDFGAEGFVLDPAGTRHGQNYTDWGWTLMRLQVPEDAEGEHGIEIHVGDHVVPVTLQVNDFVRTALPGDRVDVSFDGRFDDTGEQFWEGTIRGITIGSGGLVTGVDLGLAGLAQGETQTLVLPPALTYGYDNQVGSGFEQFNGEWLRFTVSVDRLH